MYYSKLIRTIETYLIFKSCSADQITDEEYNIFLSVFAFPVNVLHLPLPVVDNLYNTKIGIEKHDKRIADSIYRFNFNHFTTKRRNFSFLLSPIIRIHMEEEGVIQPLPYIFKCTLHLRHESSKLIRP